MLCSKTLNLRPGCLPILCQRLEWLISLTPFTCCTLICSYIEEIYADLSDTNKKDIVLKSPFVTAWCNMQAHVPMHHFHYFGYFLSVHIIVEEYWYLWSWQCIPHITVGVGTTEYYMVKNLFWKEQLCEIPYGETQQMESDYKVELIF